MQNNTVIIDMDSVLSEFGEQSIIAYNEKYGTNYIPEDIKSWDMYKWLNCTPEQLYEIWSPSFFLSVKPRDYAKQMFVDLKDMGFRPVVVTAYRATHALVKMQWLGKYLGLCEKDVVFCNDKHLVKGGFRLDDRVKNFFDDNNNVIENCEHVIFNQPYNIDGIEGDCKLRSYYRVNNLREFVEIMQNFKEKSKI